MKKFNLKTASKNKAPSISEKTIEKNRETMGIDAESQGTIEKNINLSLPTKDKDNTVPFNVQLEASRKNEKDQQIIEAKMDSKQVNFGDKFEQISPINKESQKYDNEKLKKFKEAQDKDKETLFWDKYIGVQMDGETTKVPDNIPPEASQLQNIPEKLASLKDADAMLFHIYASAKKEGREINDSEKQQIIDINSGKNRILAQMQSPQERIRRSVLQPRTASVSLICGKCKNNWSENWGSIRANNGDAVCPKCGLKDYIGEEFDYD